MTLVVATMARESHFGNNTCRTRISLLGCTALSRAKRSVADSLLVSHIRMNHELLHILRVTNYDISDELQTKYTCATRSSQGGKTRVHFFFLIVWTRNLNENQSADDYHVDGVFVCVPTKQVMP